MSTERYSLSHAFSRDEIERCRMGLDQLVQETTKRMIIECREKFGRDPDQLIQSGFVLHHVVREKNGVQYHDLTLSPPPPRRIKQ